MDSKEKNHTVMGSTRDDEFDVGSRRSFMVNAGLAAGGIAALGAGVGSTSAAAAAGAGSRAVKKEVRRQDDEYEISLDWKEVYYTNCPLISASNVDQELGWTSEEFAKDRCRVCLLHSPSARRPTGTRITFTTRRT